MLTGVMPEREDTIVRALVAGLRAIPAARLHQYGHARPAVATPTTRLRFVTFCALAVGSWAVVQFDDVLCARVAMILTHADGDVLLERVARFVETGGVFDA